MLSFEANCIELEIIMLNEISMAQNDKHNMISHTWNPRKWISYKRDSSSQKLERLEEEREKWERSINGY
jgi:hypothetical protein